MSMMTRTELDAALKSYFDVNIENTNTSDINDWKFVNGISLDNLFKDYSQFNEDISAWDVSEVTDMAGMFKGAVQFNQDISGWNVGSVTTMRQMFMGAIVYTGETGGVWEWVLSSIVDMSYMFSGASMFDGDISKWTIRNSMEAAESINMGHMFQNAIQFNQDISSWDVVLVTNMKLMFDGAIAYTGLVTNENVWNVSSVTDMAGMFQNATQFNQDISGVWVVLQICSQCFKMPYNLTKIYLVGM